jgi:hypothetical protein
MGRECREQLSERLTGRQRLGAKLDPALREWADRVIIPALAREFLANQDSKQIAKDVPSVAQFETKNGPSARGTL